MVDYEEIQIHRMFADVQRVLVGPSLNSKEYY